MKKTMISLAALMMAASLCGCNGGSSSQNSETPAATTAVTDVTTTDETAAVTTVATTTAEKSDEAPTINVEELGLTEENFPKLDGSTSAIPLDAGVYASLFGKTQEEVEALTVHTTTHQSFERLVKGEVDGIYTVPISAEQQAAADAANVKLESIPVAAEGFVFVVNAKNPVESLTQQQIRDIYSGKITNWKEVGGNDAEILPYQRNTDSGSQNYMTEFMKGYNLMEPKKEYIQYGMAGILDSIVVNDNGVNAIGYSVYSYAAEMYAQQGDIKFIAIDGVKPSLASMEAGEYPLLSCSYFMFNADAAEDAPVRKLATYLKSKQGQQAVVDAGYVAIK